MLLHLYLKVGAMGSLSVFIADDSCSGSPGGLPVPSGRKPLPPQGSARFTQVQFSGFLKPAQAATPGHTICDNCDNVEICGRMMEEEEGRDVEQALYFVSTTGSSFHIPESGTFPQLRFNPETEDPQHQPSDGSSNSCGTDLTDSEQFRINPVEILAVGSAAPPLPIVLKFEDVKYKVELKPAVQSWNSRLKSVTKVRHIPIEKHILNGVTASVAPGEILALMGASGSGKTTLLNILGGRFQKNVTGRITYNGQPYSSVLKRRMGFVTQDDILFPTLTVRESLVFAALLRLPNSMSQIQKILRADSVLKDLGLERCRHTIIGGQFIRGVSGGERKRTSIGYEILVDPSVLFLDEPTSGLDSTTALKILKVLQSNAQVGRVIVTTIHQPSSRMFHMFDKLILISEGNALYSGYANEAMEYFGSLNFNPQIAMNPADFLLDLATGVTGDITLPEDLERFAQGMVPSTTAKRGLRVGTLVNELGHVWARSGSQKEVSEEYQRALVLKYLTRKYKTKVEPLEKQFMHHDTRKVHKDLEEATKAKKDWTSSWGTQFLILFKRTWMGRRKNYFGILKFAQAIGVAVILGLLWWDQKLDTNANIQDQLGLLFYICIFWATFSMWTTLMTYPMDRQYLAKERAADMYHLSAYYLSSTICDSLADLIYPTIFTIILYFMASLRKTFVAFLLTLLATFLISITGQGFGEVFGAATLSLRTAGVIASLCLLIFLLVGGYYVQRIPIFMRWVKYISFIYHGFRLLQKIQYSGDQTFGCSTGCERVAASPALRGLKLNSGLEEAWVLILMAIGFRLLTYLCLRRI